MKSFLLALFLVPLPLVSQDGWIGGHHHQPRYWVHRIRDGDLVTALELRKGPQGQLVQRLELPLKEVPKEVGTDGLDLSGTISMADYNFDGRNDIAVVGFSPVYGNDTTFIWLWDPIRHRFIHHPEFLRLSSPKPNLHHHFIESDFIKRMGTGERVTSRYRWRNGKLTKTFEQETTYDFDQQKWTIERRWPSGGRWKHRRTVTMKAPE